MLRPSAPAFPEKGEITVGPITAAASFVAGLSLGALLSLWFLGVYRFLSEKRACAMHARQQLRLHREGLDQVRGSDSESAARRVLDSSREICNRICGSYNTALRRPICRIPGYLMGFRPL